MMFRRGLYVLLLTQILSVVISTTSSIEKHRIIPVQDPNDILITFGSCNAVMGDEQNDIFNRIVDLKPDTYIWLGDVTYIDVNEMPPKFKFPGEERARAKFEETKNHPNYQNLREATNIIGVWDDHDFGHNNAGKSFLHKNITKQLWLDFIDEPQNTIRRTRSSGIHESYYLGDVTKVKVILLDVRWDREEPFFLDFGGGELLGEEQWQWLEEELKDNPAEYTIIGSGIQILADDRIFTERWFTPSKERLLALIRKYKTGGLILLSGDVHYTEMMKYPCKERIGFELHEFCSSGITHYASSHVPNVDGVVSELYPYTYNSKEDRYYERNFGKVRLTFGEKKSVHMEAVNYYGATVLERQIPYEDLIFDESIINDSSVCVVDTKNHVRFALHYFESLYVDRYYVWLVTFGIVWCLTLIITVFRILRRTKLVKRIVSWPFTSMRDLLKRIIFHRQAAKQAKEKAQ